MGGTVEGGTVVKLETSASRDGEKEVGCVFMCHVVA